MDDELDSFKSKINLTEYAASVGYDIDRKASSKTSVVMRSDADKVIVSRGTNGYWIYFSVNDDADNGTIIDFIQNRSNASLGTVRKELRPWIGTERPAVPVKSYVPDITPSSADAQSVMAKYLKMEFIAGHPYLTEHRGIPSSLLISDRFNGTILKDGYRNAVFPHHNYNGLCGYEVKNRGFTGFPKGGVKGLWFSKHKPGDTTLVIAETAIDAISYAALAPDTEARYCSIGGKMNPDQPRLVAGAIAKLPHGGRVIAALDNDEGGAQIACDLEDVFQGVERGDLDFQVHTPKIEGADWNDILRQNPGLFSYRPALG